MWDSLTRGDAGGAPSMCLGCCEVTEVARVFSVSVVDRCVLCISVGVRSLSVLRLGGYSTTRISEKYKHGQTEKTRTARGFLFSVSTPSHHDGLIVSSLRSGSCGDQ